MKSKKDNNVIKFPMQKTRKTITSRFNLTQRLRRVQFERNRMFISGSIVSILILATLANTNLFSLNSADSNLQVRKVTTGRMIASVKSDSENRNDYDKEVLNLAKSNLNRRTASFGKSPSLQDKLRYETLEGKYLMQFEEGKIKSIEFTRLTQQGSEPKYVNNREEFLSRHKSLLPVNFDLAKKSSVQKSRLKTIEKFNLIDGVNSVANVEFQMDAYGRFISMKVNKLKPF